MTEAAVVFTVHGNPLPKQSFRYVTGGGYTNHEVKRWQHEVGWRAQEAMIDRPIFEGAVEVQITFWRKDLTRVDADNLSKAVLDAMNGIVFSDDTQVTDLHIKKRIDRKTPGCWIRISPAPAAESEEV